MSASAARNWLPWYDRGGTWSWLRLIVFALAAAPAVWMSYKWFGGKLSPKPVTDILRECGDWSMRFIVATLAVSPLRSLTRWNALIGVRRMLGLAALFYVCAHLLFYFIDQHFVLWRIALEIALRTYLTVGFFALAILAIMGWTSNDAAVRRLGAEKWRRIHRWIYLAALLGVLHFFLQVRIKAYEPSLLSGLLIMLGGYRLLQWRQKDVAFWRLGALAAFSAVAAAFVEAGYYRFSMNAPLWSVLQANGDFSYEIRPAWWVLAAGATMLCAATIGFLRRRTARTASNRPTPAPAE